MLSLKGELTIQSNHSLGQFCPSFDSQILKRRVQSACSLVGEHGSLCHFGVQLAGGSQGMFAGLAVGCSGGRGYSELLTLLH